MAADYISVADLSQYYYLKREIEEDKETLEALRCKILPGTPITDGMPRGSKYHGSKTERLATKLVDLENIIEEKILENTQELIRLERFISSIPDSYTRLIFIYRFVDGMTWDQVALNISLCLTSDSVKKQCYRYIRKMNQKK